MKMRILEVELDMKLAAQRQMHKTAVPNNVSKQKGYLIS